MAEVSTLSDTAAPLRSDRSPRYSISVVSHGQSELVVAFLEDLDRVRPVDFEVLLTINKPEDFPSVDRFTIPVAIVRNQVPLGFGANHNRAFARAKGRFFVVANPDIRIAEIQLSRLSEPFSDPSVGVTGPRVVDSEGRLQDSARRFPTFISLSKRVLLRQRRVDYDTSKSTAVDWVAGMFMMFRRETYSAVGGFDERRFFMYYEDVDLCRRTWAHGWKVIWAPSITVTHDAQRASHRNWAHFRWHLTSAVRYLTGW